MIPKALQIRFRSGEEPEKFHENLENGIIGFSSFAQRPLFYLTYVSYYQKPLIISFGQISQPLMKIMPTAAEGSTTEFIPPQAIVSIARSWIPDAVYQASVWYDAEGTHNAAKKIANKCGPEVCEGRTPIKVAIPALRNVFVQNIYGLELPTIELAPEPPVPLRDIITRAAAARLG